MLSIFYNFITHSSSSDASSATKNNNTETKNDSSATINTTTATAIPLVSSTVNVESPNSPTSAKKVNEDNSEAVEGAVAPISQFDVEKFFNEAKELLDQTIAFNKKYEKQINLNEEERKSYVEEYKKIHEKAQNLKMQFDDSYDYLFIIRSLVNKSNNELNEKQKMLREIQDSLEGMKLIRNNLMKKEKEGKKGFFASWFYKSQYPIATDFAQLKSSETVKKKKQTRSNKKLEIIKKQWDNLCTYYDVLTKLSESITIENKANIGLIIKTMQSVKESFIIQTHILQILLFLESKPKFMEEIKSGDFSEISKEKVDPRDVLDKKVLELEDKFSIEDNKLVAGNFFFDKLISLYKQTDSSKSEKEILPQLISEIKAANTDQNIGITPDALKNFVGMLYDIIPNVKDKVDEVLQTSVKLTNTYSQQLKDWVMSIQEIGKTNSAIVSESWLTSHPNLKKIWQIKHNAADMLQKTLNPDEKENSNQKTSGKFNFVLSLIVVLCTIAFAIPAVEGLHKELKKANGDQHELEEEVENHTSEEN